MAEARRKPASTGSAAAAAQTDARVGPQAGAHAAAQTDAQADERSLAPAVTRAARLLELLETRPQAPFPLQEIAQRLGIAKSTAYNICCALVDAQLLRRAQGGFQLGRRLVQLGSSYVASVDVVREFYEACRPLPGSLHALVQLSALDAGLNVVFLARQDCDSGLRLGLGAEIGRRVPAHCTASGKALLASLPAAELEARLAGAGPLPRLTAASIGTVRALKAELGRVRLRGHATDVDGAVAGVSCVATTVATSHREDGLVAVSVTAAKEGLTAARSRALVDALGSIAGTLRARL